MHVRTVVRRSGLGVGVAGALVGILVWSTGGFETDVFGMAVRSRTASRPFTLAVLGALAYLLAGGRVDWPQSWEVNRRRRAFHVLAIALSAMTFALGLVYATTAVGGADSYGYASQADLWIQGRPVVKQPWASTVPWPLAIETFTPLGYTPSPREPWALIPMYPPGLPWLMAAGKVIGGQEGMFWITAISGALLVIATYGIGCRLASPVAGVTGAWLVATSPVMLFMLMSPMSDVPAAAAWAVAFYFLLGASGPSALLAGLAAALAIVIRPNLLFGALIMGCWYAIGTWRAAPRARTKPLRLMVLFALGVLPGVTAIALVNDYMTGSPLQSGYGTLQNYFALSYFRPNVEGYLGWLVRIQTPLVLLGFAALTVPLRQVWPSARDRAVILAISGFVLAVWLFYCFYLHFEAWWFLRFLLPTWPFIMVATGAAVAALVRQTPSFVQGAAAVLIVVVGMYGVRVARDRYVFDQWKADRHYAAVGRLVREMTAEQSVILSMQHSGSLRYYAGRLTLRYDLLDGKWLDSAVAWLSARGVRPYLLVHDWEIPEVVEHFPGQRTLAQLELPPVLHYRGRASVMLFDLARETADSYPPPRLVDDSYAGLRSLPPAPLVPPSFD